MQIDIGQLLVELIVELVRNTMGRSIAMLGLAGVMLSPINSFALKCVLSVCLLLLLEWCCDLKVIGVSAAVFASVTASLLAANSFQWVIGLRERVGEHVSTHKLTFHTRELLWGMLLFGTGLSIAPWKEVGASAPIDMVTGVGIGLISSAVWFNALTAKHWHYSRWIIVSVVGSWFVLYTAAFFSPDVGQAIGDAPCVAMFGAALRYSGVRIRQC